jgi:hypothetical protein
MATMNQPPQAQRKMDFYTWLAEAGAPNVCDGTRELREGWKRGDSPSKWRVKAQRHQANENRAALRLDV